MSTSFFSDSHSSTFDLDVAVIGAGISGINTGYRLQTQCPGIRYSIFEARADLGGTWDLFRYPGTRSDSDLYTFGFEWKRWKSDHPFAERERLIEYLKDCTHWAGIDKRIIYNTRLATADWSNADQHWTLTLNAEDGQQRKVRCRFVIFGTGYYDYAKPMEVHIPGLENFKGKVIHPQFWPEDYDYTDKKIVIIGSGATAVTLVPNLAAKASHVIMLQRSPGFVAVLPKVDSSAVWLRNLLPDSIASYIIRLKYLCFSFLFFRFCRAFPLRARKVVQAGIQKELPSRVPLKPSFDPQYNPWEQRFCVAPGGDFFQSLRDGKADVVTGQIRMVSESAIDMVNGERITSPDVIVTATGLKVSILGGVKVSVDGQIVDITSKFVWKGSMIENLPNSALMIGYTNASWTLGADATGQLLTRLLNRMRKDGITSVAPVVEEPDTMKQVPLLNLSSTYIIKAQGEFPKAGDKYPWKPRDAYFFDIWEARYGNLMKGLAVTKSKA